MEEKYWIEEDSREDVGSCDGRMHAGDREFGYVVPEVSEVVEATDQCTVVATTCDHRQLK